MAGAWQRMGWREVQEPTSFRAVYHPGSPSVGWLTSTAAVVGVVVSWLAFWSGPKNLGAGGVPVAALLLVCVPVGAYGVLSTVAVALEIRRRVTIVMDRGGCMSVASEGYEQRVPLSEIDGFGEEHGLVHAFSRSGEWLVTLPALAESSHFVIPRLERALAWARTPFGPRP